VYVSEAPVQVTALGDGRFAVDEDGRRRIAYGVAAAGRVWVFLDGRTYIVDTASRGERSSRGRQDDPSALAAPMPASVVSIDVTPGQDVRSGDVLIRLEAMKMELPIKAPRDGRVVSIGCRVGELVQPGVPLLELA
jgi:biotin carboxyl carrier protein